MDEKNLLLLSGASYDIRKEVKAFNSQITSLLFDPIILLNFNLEKVKILKRTSQQLIALSID